MILKCTNIIIWAGAGSFLRNTRTHGLWGCILALVMAKSFLSVRLSFNDADIILTLSKQARAQVRMKREIFCCVACAYIAALDLYPSPNSRHELMISSMRLSYTVCG